MNGETKEANAHALQLEGMREELEFYQRLLSKPEDSTEKREVLLSYCSRQSVKEREVWWNLALFRETGAEGLLYESPPDCYFDSLNNTLRRQILSGIKKIPLETLTDFRELIVFTSLFLDRAQFLCDFLLRLFLLRESGCYRESQDMSEYTNFFVQKMFREIDRIHEITNLNLFSDLNDLYEQWLSDKAVDEEVLI